MCLTPLLCLPWAVAAHDLPQPKGPVILTVTGDIGCTNSGKEAHFDRSMLEALGTVSIRTATLWTDGVQEFAGVTLRRLLDAVCASGTMIDAWAVNDYWAEIPVTDAVDDGPILAFAQNGLPLTLRDKGPIWIVYPYDTNPAYHSEVIYARSVWQLLRLDIRD